VNALRIASLLFGLLTSSLLMFCGVVMLALAPWVPGLRWAAGVCMFVGMW
jgi:hypothetical protein